VRGDDTLAPTRSFVKAALLVAGFAAACGGPPGPEPFVVTARYPHDSTAYTQGLVSSGGVLLESTGLYGHSELRRVDVRSGRVLDSVRLPADRFGEGLALLRGRLYQLTWKAGVAYVYDAATFALVDSLRYPGEGWGLATDGTSLIMSDGSDSLRFLDPATFRVRRVVHVRYQGSPLRQLNELEYVNGDLLANVYQSNWVLRIDPRTGDVKAVLDLTDLYPARQRPPWADVMNGIAVADSGRLYLTGKLWPVLFEVRLRRSTAP
jgi:glutaminyl-peptide cyclotransferase